MCGCTCVRMRTHSLALMHVCASFFVDQVFVFASTHTHKGLSTAALHPSAFNAAFNAAPLLV
jgi:hypothetical protein